MHRQLKNTGLKRMYIVRYADDFKVFTDNHKSAVKIKHALKDYLKNQLKLEMSEEKSQITNIRKRSSEFLGFELRAYKRKKKHICYSRIAAKKKQIIKEKIKELVKKIQKEPTYQNASQYNSYILGVHNYYRGAAKVNRDFCDISYSCLRILHNRLQHTGVYELPRSPPILYKSLFKNKYKVYKVCGIYLFPIADIQWKMPLSFSQHICDYTKMGRSRNFTELSSTVVEEIGYLNDARIEITQVEKRVISF